MCTHAPTPMQNTTVYMYDINIYIYLRVSVRLFAVNAKTTAWIDAKR